MAKQITVTVDSSEQSTKALSYAVEEEPDAELTLIHAYGLDAHAGRGVVVQLTSEAIDASEEQAKQVPENAKNISVDAGWYVSIEMVAEAGDPEKIITYHPEDADAVYIGSHGRKRTARVLGWSVGKKSPGALLFQLLSWSNSTRAQTALPMTCTRRYFVLANIMLNVLSGLDAIADNTAANRRP